MNLRDIEYILSAAKNGSFARAAAECHVSQPSLSVQIKKIEGRLGHSLFIRDKKGVRLSPMGEKILPHFKAMQDSANEIFQISTTHSAADDNAPIKLGAIATVAPYIIPHIANFRQINFEESTTAELIKKLLDDEIDAALLALPIKVPQLKSLSLYKEKFFLVGAKKNKNIAAMDFKTMIPPEHSRFLILSDEHCMGEQAINLCRLNDDMTRKMFRARSLETIRQMVASSDDITLMPETARRAHDGLTYYPLPAKFYRTIGLVYKNKNLKIEQIQALHQQMKALDILHAV